MGISGLLPVLKEIQVPRNISDFKGQRWVGVDTADGSLAVDAYVWLHRGAFGCAEDLVKGRKTTRFVDYAMNRVGMLRHHGITPYVVFDGGPLPAKRGTEVSRAKWVHRGRADTRSRSDNLARAYAYEAQGRLKEARDCYTKCIDITPEMAYQLIKVRGFLFSDNRPCVRRASTTWLLRMRQMPSSASWSVRGLWTALSPRTLISSCSDAKTWFSNSTRMGRVFRLTGRAWHSCGSFQCTGGPILSSAAWL